MAISKKMQDVFKKGVEVSKDLASKAGAKAKELGEMGMLKLEIFQLRSRTDKLTSKLGSEVYSSFVDKNASSVNKDVPEIAELVKEIGRLRSTIEQKEKDFRAIGGKAEDLAPAKVEQPEQ